MTFLETARRHGDRTLGVIHWLLELKAEMPEGLPMMDTFKLYNFYRRHARKNMLPMYKCWSSVVRIINSVSPSCITRYRPLLNGYRVRQQQIDLDMFIEDFTAAIEARERQLAQTDPCISPHSQSIPATSVATTVDTPVEPEATSTEEDSATDQA